MTFDVLVCGVINFFMHWAGFYFGKGLKLVGQNPDNRNRKSLKYNYLKTCQSSQFKYINPETR